MSKRIEILIEEEGEVTIEAFGFTGKSCEIATKDYEDALGAATSKIKKPEMFTKEIKKIEKVRR